MDNNIKDKQIWSAVKAEYERTRGRFQLPWEQLSESTRLRFRERFLKLDKTVAPTEQASAPELRAQLRKARIDNAILERQVEALRACLRGEHAFPAARQSGGCFTCGKMP